MDELKGINGAQSNQKIRQAQKGFIQGSGMNVNMPHLKNLPEMEKPNSFQNILEQYVNQVNTLQHQSDAQVQRLVAGETKNLHDVMLAMDEAKTSFDMMIEVRNKLLSAYQELVK